MRRDLSPLPLAEWRATRDRLHRWARLAGAVRRQCSPHRKHWWHIGLVPSARGLTTTPFGTPHGCAELELDLHRGELGLTADDAREQRIALSADPARGGRDELLAALGTLEVAVDLPRFDAAAGGEYDAAAARRYLRVLHAVASALRQLQAECHEETSPLQLWPHHFDLALGWFSGRAVPGKEHCEPDDRNESVTVGFSTGDDGDPEPYVYAIAYPWPADIDASPLPVGRWHGPGWNGGYLPWAEAAASGDPGATVLVFARAARRALAEAQQAMLARA